MISKRLLQLCLVALSASQVAQAHYGAAVHGGAVARAEMDLEKRQSSSTSSAPSTTPRPSSTTNAPAPSTTTTNRPTSSETPRPSTTTTQNPPSSTSTKPEPSQSPSESEKPSDTTTSPPPKTVTTPPPETSTVVETVTNTDGSVSTRTSESVTTRPPSEVPVPDTNNNTGMTPQTRNTIIGVVVGVGGAIILAVIGLFAWRMWGRKKAAEEGDGLMDYGTPGYHPGPAEPKEPSVPGSSSVGTGRSPFQSTLESYHAPTQVNTASNF